MDEANNPVQYTARGRSERKQMEWALRDSIKMANQLQKEPPTVDQDNQQAGAQKQGGAKRKPTKPPTEGKQPARKVKKQEPDEAMPWITEQNLVFAYRQRMESGKAIPAWLRRKMEALVKKLEEPNCYVNVFDVRAAPTANNDEPAAAPNEDENGHTFPDEDDSRHMYEYYLKTTFPPPVRNPVGASMTTTPMVKLAAPLMFDLATVTAGQITGRARSSYGMGKKNSENSVYVHIYKIKLPNDKDNKTVEEYRKMFPHPEIATLEGIQQNRLAGEAFVVEKGFDEAQLEKWVYTSGISIVRGLDKARDMDLSVFQPRVLKNLTADGALIRLLRQHVQECTSNFHPGQLKNRWVVPLYTHEVEFSKFADNFQELQDIAIKAFDELCNAPEDEQYEIIRKLTEDIVSKQLAVPKELGKLGERKTAVTSFGSNFDLNDQVVYREQFTELNKLPIFFLPNAPGGFSTYMGENIAGIDLYQVYFKGPGQRTTGHQENQWLMSFNLNIGPGDCIWICIPVEYTKKFLEFLKQKQYTPYHTPYWPDEGELLLKGIPVIKMLQKPGDLMTVGIGTFHWVQSNGYTVNVAWNSGRLNFPQLSAAMISHDHNSEQEYQTAIAIIPMAWNIIRQQVDLDAATKLLVKRIASVSLAKSVFEEVFAARNDLTLQAAGAGHFRMVERCCVEKCNRNVLFNTVVVWAKDRFDGAKGEEKNNYLCVDCARKGKEEILANGTLTGYQRYPIQDLEEQFDAYFFPNARGAIE